jgi:hypothetical protein
VFQYYYSADAAEISPVKEVSSEPHAYFLPPFRKESRIKACLLNEYDVQVFIFSVALQHASAPIEKSTTFYWC